MSVKQGSRKLNKTFRSQASLFFIAAKKEKQKIKYFQVSINIRVTITRLIYYYFKANYG